MTAVAPQGTVPGPQSSGDPSAASLPSWEGDKMFNIYIYDYCYKRGFRKTARELLQEAEIPSDSTPPINARQGLLFEWWSVFWVLFTAKANGNGTEDAMVYTQHQAHQAALKQNQNRAQAPPQPGMLSQLQPLGPRGSMNGVGRGFPPNGVMTNGMPPGVQPVGPTSFHMSGPPQPNGIMPGPSVPPMGQQPFLGQQRLPLGGPPRPPNGGPPFQSPTMAHSPPNPGQQQSQTPQQPQHAQPPMGQLGPPHRGGMLPPGQQGMNPGQQTPTASYQPLTGRPPSRTSTPQSGIMTHPSPSMAPRQPMVPGTDPRDVNGINNELQNIPNQIFNMLKQELGLGDKNIHSLTLQDKQRIITHNRQRSQKPGLPGSNNAAAGPSMQAPPQRRNKRNSTSPGEDQQQQDDGVPRNGSSPPDRKRVRRSPMDPQISTAPMTAYPQHPNQPPQPQPGGPGGPQQHQQPMGNGMMRPMSGPMNGFLPQAQANMQQQMGGPMNMLGMNPMMGNAMSPQMHPQLQYRQSLHGLQHPNRMQGGMNAGSPGSDPSFNPGVPMQPGPGGPQQQQQPGPGPGQQQFAPGSRLTGPPNPKPMSMLPPPSPAKDQNGPNKDNKPPNGLPEGSPRNQPIAGPNAPGTAPPTPTNQSQPAQSQNMAPSPSSGMILNPNSAMNPVAMPLSGGPAPASATDSLFSSEFIQGVATTLDEFDVGLFRADGDINFERDFGQWFNPDDMGSMELGKQ
ncbi:hypothetical protein B0H10DRAFT_1871923 [Mycena sp. CBHHK59/15]|nr:hypothetical protein B0H10DRAFT_1871923 [Mycena sp. CBHHK59/15]